jgi:hypothetical protein
MPSASASYTDLTARRLFVIGGFVGWIGLRRKLLWGGSAMRWVIRGGRREFAGSLERRGSRKKTVSLGDLGGQECPRNFQGHLPYIARDLCDNILTVGFHFFLGKPFYDVFFPNAGSK